jgi:amino acid transporter
MTQLRRELGLRDVVLAQLLVIIGTPSFGPAARLGGANTAVWIAGIALFHIPLAVVVQHLNRRTPMEGGLYQWAKLAYGETAGFLTAWNTWLFSIFFTSLLGLSVTTAVAYALNMPALASSKAAAVGASATVMLALTTLSILGLGIGKQVHNIATVVFLVVMAALIVLPFVTGTRYPAMTAAPAPTLLNLAIVTRMAVYALAGYETLPILAGEMRDPERTIGRSMVIAVPLVAILYILGTNAILAFVPADKVDLINPIAQAFGAAGIGTAAATLLLLGRDLATSSQLFAATTRLPMTAGWDRLLPAWFTRLDPRRATPRNSIVFVGATTFVISLLGIAGVDRQEGFQILQSAAGVLFAATYVVLFSLPLATPAPPLVRLAAVSGLVVTAAFIVLALFPITDVQSSAAYAAKIAAAVAVVNGVGVAVALAGRRRRLSRFAVDDPAGD